MEASCAVDGGGAARHPTGALKQGSGACRRFCADGNTGRARGVASSELGQSEQWRDGGDAGHGTHGLQVLRTPVMVWRMTQACRASWECDLSALCVRGADKATREVRYQRCGARRLVQRTAGVGFEGHFGCVIERQKGEEVAKVSADTIVACGWGCARGSGKPQLPPVVAGVVRSDPGRRGGDGHRWSAGGASPNAGAAKLSSTQAGRVLLGRELRRYERVEEAGETQE
ncbi:hypothetical protein B0H13DRAFT_1929756 [Mycena leptocephala]|nr:hypothetical protein B0H13DRAFT_1929756 [Mycena leptocephala]